MMQPNTQSKPWLLGLAVAIAIACPPTTWATDVVPATRCVATTMFACDSPVASANEVAKLDGVTTLPWRLPLKTWQTYPAGPWNAITDVPGVIVGHVSLRAPESSEAPVGIRTGVTAVWVDPVGMEGIRQPVVPLPELGFWAASAVHNGNGEVTGLASIDTFGVLNSPILLTNTRSVGMIHNGVHRYMNATYPKATWSELPVVGECWDGVFNSIQAESITPDDAALALKSARPGPVWQGRVGAGSGMRSFELYGGIGSASRQIELNGNTYTIGVLVNTNHSKLAALNPAIKSALSSELGDLTERSKRLLPSQHASMTLPTSRQGSIVVIIATDIPLMPQQLKQLAQRAAIGIGLTGSVMATTSGDFVVAFSTANPIAVSSTNSANAGWVNADSPWRHPDAMTPLYTMTIESVLEAQVNALSAANGIPSGSKGHKRP